MHADMYMYVYLHVCIDAEACQLHKAVATTQSHSL
jgi:hypothetical protein